MFLLAGGHGAAERACFCLRAGMAHGATRSKQKERAAGATRSKNTTMVPPAPSPLPANLVSVESSTACDRINLVLTGTSARSPLKFLPCDMGEVDNNAHAKTCPATAQHRVVRFLRMAEVMASIIAGGETMHHDPSLRPSVHALLGVDVRRLLSGIQVVPYHEQTPIHTLPQSTTPPHGQDTATRFGVWDCGPGHKRTLRAVVLATPPLPRSCECCVLVVVCCLLFVVALLLCCFVVV